MVNIELGKEYIVSVGTKKFDYQYLIEAKEELIRCKDCVFYVQGKLDWTGWCEISNRYESPTFYCGYAKRREEHESAKENS